MLYEYLQEIEESLVKGFSHSREIYRLSQIIDYRKTVRAFVESVSKLNIGGQSIIMGRLGVVLDTLLHRLQSRGYQGLPEAGRQSPCWPVACCLLPFTKNFHFTNFS